jgi:hypothetical protein
MSTIDRLLFYDGEFLRAFDFSDEQTYHMEMRRRLNRYLHLYGIARGLQLNEDVQAGIHEVSILPGFAIDAFGREIYVFVPYTLGDQDVQNARIPASGGLYDVWLRYNKTAQTPPSAGYNNCNQTNQFTRWLENFSVVLLVSPSNPFTPPAFTDDDNDDPAQDQVGVLLGTVNVIPGSVTAQFSNPVFHHRHFIGVIAQRIQTPYGYDATSSFNFKLQNTPRRPPVSLDIEPNIFAKQNVIVGPDFDLTKTSSGVAISIKPAATTNPTGSIKLAGDLFAQGNIYSFIPDPVNPQWLGLPNYVQQLVQQQLPDFVATTAPTTVTPTNPAPSVGSFSDSVTIQIPSKLSSMSLVVPSASIAGIQFNTPASMNQVGVFITNVSGATGINKCTVNVTYTISGVPASLATPILSFYVTATAVCFP